MAGDGNECSAGQLTITGLCDVLGDGITDSVGFLFFCWWTGESSRTDR